jgi:hypothetical protein
VYGDKFIVEHLRSCNVSKENLFLAIQKIGEIFDSGGGEIIGNFAMFVGDKKFIVSMFKWNLK